MTTATKLKDSQSKKAEDLAPLKPLDSNRERLLLIDDDKLITDLLEKAGTDAGFQVRAVNEYEHIKRAIKAFNPTVIFLDLDLGVDADMDLSDKGFDGLEVLKYLAYLESRSRVVIISGMPRHVRELNLRLGREMGLRLVGQMPKPFELDKIREILQRLQAGRKQASA